MSIALDRGGGGGNRMIQRTQFNHGMSCHRTRYDSSGTGVFGGGGGGGDRRCPVVKVEKCEEDSDSCSSSSIGRNSDLSSGSSSCEGEDSGETEVQSSFKGPLDTMDALQDVLPISIFLGEICCGQFVGSLLFPWSVLVVVVGLLKVEKGFAIPLDLGPCFWRGISNFYNGKSKSFTSLSDATSSSSVKELAKPENPCNRKRKNELAHSKIWDKNRNYPLKSKDGGILKRPANFNRSAVTLSSMGSENNNEDSRSSSLSPPLCLPPLHPQSKKSPNSGSSSPPLPPPRQNNSPWRSFSLSDLQCIASGTPSITGMVQ